MTPVELHFITPTGDPVANTPALIQLTRSGFTEDVSGIALPAPVTVTTDADGKATVDLWPSSSMYFIEVNDAVSGATLFYKFLVPEVAPGATVRLQDIVINGPMSQTNYDEAALVVIHQARQASQASALAAAASATTAAATVANVQADVAAALAAAEQILQDGQDTAADAAAAAASAASAAASLSTVQGLANNANVDAAAAIAAGAAAEAARAIAVAASTSAVTARDAAQASEDAAELAATNLAAAVASASTSATQANTSAGNAATSAAAAAQAAIDAQNAAGNPVSSFNTRSGAVTLLSADVTAALGFTPYSAANPNSYLSLATLLTLDGAASGLDSDLLDGYHGAYYLDLANATGTLPAARLSGTYNISVAGSAGTAAALAVARTITIGSSGKLFDGSGALAWSLAEIGAQAELVSGTNIKTINGASLLGAGNVDTGAAITGLPIDITANTTLTPSKRHFINTDGGPLTLQMPAAPTPGMCLITVDATLGAGTNNVTLNGNGSLMPGGDTTYVMDRAGESIFWIYDSVKGWVRG